MITFDTLWQHLADHGSSPRNRAEASLLWDRLTPEQQQRLFDTICAKLRQNRFVHYDPVRAILENTRTTPPSQLSYGEYYSTYRTTEPKDGWRMTKDSNGKIIYIKPANIV